MQFIPAADEAGKVEVFINKKMKAKSPSSSSGATGEEAAVAPKLPNLSSLKFSDEVALKEICKIVNDCKIGRAEQYIYFMSKVGHFRCLLPTAHILSCLLSVDS
jgi:hypothetical protein